MAYAHETSRRHPAPVGSDTIEGCTATGVLKVIALVFMFIDHAGKMVFSSYPEMRMLGRIAFPLYCWCMVVGISYTRSVSRYLLRIALLGLISQPLYMVALNHSVQTPNIFLTLFIALCAVWGIREKKMLSHIWAPVLALCAAQVLGCDYGWRGVMLVMLLYDVRKSRAGIACVMVAYCLFWGSGSSQITSAFGINLSSLITSPVGGVISPWLRMQALAILALPLMLLPTSARIKMPRLLSYSLYPLHLVLLIALEAFFGLTIHTEQLVNAWNALIALF